ncbi:MAG: hypothetical protein NC217_00600 [Muribaculaceae bacterium]|nr:hypothetical protein [Muribaculaceae bacterium]
MKKGLFASALAVALLASCSNRKTVNIDSTQADTATIVSETESNTTTGVESTAESISTEELDQAYKKPLTLTQKSSTHKFGAESSTGVATAVYTVTNNTPVDLEAADYNISYGYPAETTQGGELVEIDSFAIVPGVDVPAGQSAEITLKGNDAIGKISTAQIVFSLSKEDFIKKATK